MLFLFYVSLISLLFNSQERVKVANGLLDASRLESAKLSRRLSAKSRTLAEAKREVGAFKHTNTYIIHNTSTSIMHTHMRVLHTVVYHTPVYITLCTTPGENVFQLDFLGRKSLHCHKENVHLMTDLGEIVSSATNCGRTSAVVLARMGLEQRCITGGDTHILYILNPHSSLRGRDDMSNVG